MKYTVVSFLFLSIFLFSNESVGKITQTDSFSYGVKLTTKEYLREGEDWVERTELIIMQNKKVIDTLSNEKIAEIYRGDLDGDGIVELVFEGFSGGAHCCFDAAIIPIVPKMQKPKLLSLLNSSIDVKDVNSDGKMELIMGDDLYSYFESLCYACSPGITVVVDYDKGELSLNPKLTEILNQEVTKEKLSMTRVSFKEDVFGFDDGESGYKTVHTLNLFLYYLYTGKHEKGMKILDDYFVYNTPANKQLFYKRLMKAAQNSRFWEDIKRINHLPLEVMK